MATVDPTQARGDAATLSRLRALLRVAGVVRSREDVQPLLEAVAHTVAETLGFGAAVINLRRPAWDDMEVVVVVDHSNPAVSALLGEHIGLDQVDRLLDPRFDRGGAFFLPREEFDVFGLDMAREVGTVRGEGKGGWHPEDMLVTPLVGSDGELLGFISLDDPVDGRRPSDGLLETVAAVAAIVASVIEHAQVLAESARRRAAVEHLLRVSSELAVPSSRRRMLHAVCEAVRDALSFEKVAVFLDTAGTEAGVAAAVGFDGPPPEFDPVTILPMLRAEYMREGCVLLSSEQARTLVPSNYGETYVSTRNGRGPAAWNHHWLMVPLVDRSGRTVGVLWADEPLDYLLPSDDDLRALRAFANHAVTAIESSRALDTMRHLAEHDPLTGLRNRRTFEPDIADVLRDRPAALLVLDLDHFKQVNDTLGHTAGDEVLKRFAGVVSGFVRECDAPTRLGGEEFALTLPGVTEGEAVAVAERVRHAVAAAFTDSPVSVTVSIGIATAQPGGSAAELVREANRALFAAKKLGRNRCVVHDPATLAVLGALADQADENLAAAILLAETLDLRDAGTAQHSTTVGLYAERVARELGLPPERVERIRVAGVLHDNKLLAKTNTAPTTVAA